MKHILPLLRGHWAWVCVRVAEMWYSVWFVTERRARGLRVETAATQKVGFGKRAARERGQSRVQVSRKTDYEMNDKTASHDQKLNSGIYMENHYQLQHHQRCVSVVCICIDRKFARAPYLWGGCTAYTSSVDRCTLAEHPTVQQNWCRWMRQMRANCIPIKSHYMKVGHGIRKIIYGCDSANGRATGLNGRWIRMHAARAATNLK